MRAIRNSTTAQSCKVPSKGRQSKATGDARLIFGKVQLAPKGCFTAHPPAVSHKGNAILVMLQNDADWVGGGVLR